MVREQKSDDKWIGIYWRPAAAIVYLLICLFDFIVVPAWLGLHGSTKLTDIVMLIKDLPPETQVAVINLKLSVWQPLTLMGGGLFHLAFGAILGAAAWSRGQERITAINNGMYETNDGYYSGPNSQSPMGAMSPMMNNFGAIAGSMQASTQTTQTTQTSVQVDNPDAGGYNPEMQDAPQR